LAALFGYLKEESVNLVSILRFLAALSWLLVFGLVALVLVRATRGRPLRNANSLIIGVAIVALIINVAAAGLVFVQPQERGVVVTIGEGGVRPEALQPGINWVLPYAENVVMYRISRDTYTMSIAPEEGQIPGDDSVEARTSDGQIVRVDASVIFSVDPAEVINVHIRWQDRYINGLVRPLARGVIRDAVAQFGIEEVYSLRRLDMTNLIRSELEERLAQNGILLIDFVLRNIAFSDEYAASVEQKQIAEQLAQQAAFTVEQRFQEAEQARQVAQGEADAVVIRATGQAEARIIEAQAEAEALELLAAAIADNPDVLTLQYIEKLSPTIRTILVPTENPFILPLDGVTNSP
jgi:regulator of protease activity HflC (stomatin/prohibitin superfamily)